MHHHQSSHMRGNNANMPPLHQRHHHGCCTTPRADLALELTAAAGTAFSLSTTEEPTSCSAAGGIFLAADSVASWLRSWRLSFCVSMSTSYCAGGRGRETVGIGRERGREEAAYQCECP